MSLLAFYLQEKQFQYILCYGSTKVLDGNCYLVKYFNTSYVTVQPPFCLLNSSFLSNFNTSYVTVQRQRNKTCYFASGISIHPMLRFNLVFVFIYYIFFRFQYILCYGSTAFRQLHLGYGMLFQYILCYGSTFFKEVLMCAFTDFNTSYVTVQLVAYKPFTNDLQFQYILCYGSTISRNFTQRFLADFNTSYVTVQQIESWSKNFKRTISIHPMLRFN